MCGYPDTVPDGGSKLAHSFDYYYYDNNASCTQGGTKTAYCTLCNTAYDTVEDESHPLREHSFTDYRSDGNATCDKNGTKTAVCDNCTATDTVEDAGTAGHNYLNGTCTLCRASHLTYKAAGNVYTVSGIAADLVSGKIIVPSTENGVPVKYIEDGAFKDNISITEITLPDSIEIIGNSAFEGCTSLESVTFGNALTRVQYRAFAGCTSLESLAFPDSLITLGNRVCEGCVGLKTVSLGKNLAEFQANCFDGCTSLESVNVSAQTISFKNIGGIVYKYTGYLTLAYVPHAVSGVVTVADGLIKINGVYFQNRTQITGIYIPKSVTAISFSTFNGCVSLKDIYYEGSADDWAGIDKTGWSDEEPAYTVHYGAVKPD